MMTLPRNLYLDGNVPIRELAEFLEFVVETGGAKDINPTADEFEDWIRDFQDSYDPVKE